MMKLNPNTYYLNDSEDEEDEEEDFVQKIRR